MSRSRSPARMLALGVGVSALLAASNAPAFERQWHAGVKGGIATLENHGIGPAVGLHGAYGLSDMFDVTVELLGSRHGGTHEADVLCASAGLAYKIDVFQWIPYVALLGGYYRYEGAPGPNGEHGGVVGGSVQLGLDYLVMRELAFGADVRWHASFTDGLNFPVLFSATLGAEYRWGW